MKKKAGCSQHETKGIDGKAARLRKRDCPGCLREKVEELELAIMAAVGFVDQCGAMAHESRRNLVWLTEYTAHADKVSARLRVVVDPDSQRVG